MPTICNNERRQKIRKETKRKSFILAVSFSDLSEPSTGREGSRDVRKMNATVSFFFLPLYLPLPPSLSFPPFFTPESLGRKGFRSYKKSGKEGRREGGICSKGCLMTSIPHSVCLAAIVICLAVPICPQVAGTVILIASFSSLNSSILSPFRIK